MTQRFCYQAFLDTERYVFLQDISYSTYREFIKVLLDYNLSVINIYIDRLISDIYVDSNFDFDVKDLTCLDKLLILLTVKSYCINPEIVLEATCPETQKTFNCSTNCNEIIITILQSNIQSSYVAEQNNLKINVTLPKTIEEFSQSNILDYCIESIQYKGDIINDSNIIQSLPAGTLEDVNMFLKEQNNKFKEQPIFTYKSPHVKDAPQKSLYISLLDDSIISTIKLFYDADLLDLYETEYLLIKEHNFTEDIFKSKTPAEISAFVSIIEKHQSDNKDSENVVPTGGFPETTFDNSID